jgi:hypothetical protein
MVEKCNSSSELAKDSCASFIRTDGVLLEVRNRKEGCYAWSLIAMTSHVQTLNMLLFQDSTGLSITLFVQTPII